MLILDHPAQIKSMNLPGIVCTVGVFDGIHIGHQKIINTVINFAKEYNGTSAVITFDKHPYNIINPNIHLGLLTSPRHKLDLINSLGIDICIMMKFDKDIALTPAESWIRNILWGNMRIKVICLGEDSFFGKDQKGDINLLNSLGKELGFKVFKIDLLSTEKGPVSSTLIRNLIIKGGLISAKNLLGRTYSVYGTPVKGMGRGKEIGFPTINLDTQDQCLPPSGVYAVLINPSTGIEKSETIMAVANIGFRPTFDKKDKVPILEVHILKDQEIPIKNTIEILFIERLRDEIKFQTKEDLAIQIEKDIIKIKEIFYIN